MALTTLEDGRLYPVAMPIFDLTFLRIDRDESPTILEALFLTVDWPFLPREGEGLDIGAELDPVTVESVGYGFDGNPNVFLGRVVLDDLQAAQLRKLGWRVSPLPFSRH